MVMKVHINFRKSTKPKKIKYDSPYDSKKKKRSDTMPTDEDDEIVVEIPGDKIPVYPGTLSCRYVWYTGSVFD